MNSLDAVANTCNLSYLGDGDQEDYSLSSDKKFARSYLSYSSHPS
jgi:hypothetical protein